MESQTLELEVNVLSAKDIRGLRLSNKFYVVGWISVDPQGKQETLVDREGGKNPKWNYQMKFTIDESAAQNNNLTLMFELWRERIRGDKKCGEVKVEVPVKELLVAVNKPPRHVRVQIMNPSGKPRGVLNISYNFRAATAAESPQPVEGTGHPAQPPPQKSGFLPVAAAAAAALTFEFGAGLGGELLGQAIGGQSNPDTEP